MAGIDNGGIRERSKLRTKALAHFAFAAAFEINAPRRATEQRIARKKDARLAIESLQIQADATLGVTRSKQDLELKRTELDGFSVFDLAVDVNGSDSIPVSEIAALPAFESATLETTFAPVAFASSGRPTR